MMICLLLSCSTYERIPEDQMIDILVDMHIAEQAVREYDMADRDSISDLLMQSLLKVHNVTREQLDTNIYLYQINVEHYKVMADSVMLRLQRMSESTDPE